MCSYDIDHDAARRNEEHGRQLFAQEDARTTFAVRACGDRDEALRGADFVVMSIEPGPVEMRFADLEITRKYGILHTVGDTSCIPSSPAICRRRPPPCSRTSVPLSR